MASKRGTPGIRPGANGSGIRIEIWHKGRSVYDKTHPGNYYDKSDLAAAISLRDDKKARLRVGARLDSDDSQATQYLFSEAAQDYMSTYQGKLSTSLNYENILNQHWIPTFGNSPISEISQAAIKRKLASLSVSPKTKKNLLHPLSGIFELHGIHPNPAHGIKIKLGQKNKVNRYSIDQRNALLNDLDSEHLVYFSLLFGCGLRPGGEPLALKWTDYDGEEIEVNKIITRRTLQNSTKTDVRRRVYVPTWTREILNQHTTRFKGGYIFQRDAAGNPHLDTKEFNAAWKATHKRLKLELQKPYVCRHTRAAELLSQGINPADAANQLGHSVVMFLQIYSEFIEEYAKNKDKSRFESVGVKVKKA